MSKKVLFRQDRRSDEHVIDTYFPPLMGGNKREGDNILYFPLSLILSHKGRGDFSLVGQVPCAPDKSTELTPLFPLSF